MAYALIVEGDVAEYPFDPAQARVRFPQVSFPAVPGDEALASVGVLPVAERAQPNATAEQVVEEVTPTFSQGKWRRTWLVRDRTADDLAAAKLAKRAAINAKRDAVAAGGALTPKGMVDTNLASVVKINGAVTLANVMAAQNQPVSIPWTMADNSTVLHDGTELTVMGVAVAQFAAAVHAHALALKIAVDAAQTFTDLSAIDIETGWPT